MKCKTLHALLLSVLFICFLCGCAKKSAEAVVHEPITIQAPFMNMSEFVDLVHEKHPEIVLDVQSYSGQNMTTFMTAQRRAGDMPDIYWTTTYVPGREDLSGILLDLSGYDITNRFSEARLHDVAEDGALYLLPTYYNCFGITYNKTLLEKHGWELPKTFAELEELAPKVKAAGCNLAIDQIALPGYGFQYICNILDTCYLNTPEGRAWQNDFLDGKVKLSDSPKMLEALRTLEKWREIGMLCGSGDKASDVATKKIMAEGNTLFMLDSINAFTNDETTDEFGLMPYLSADGTQNAFILNITRYVGLNKHLEDKGNEQKLKDALTVFDLICSVEGMSALNRAYSDTSLLPLNNYEIPENNYYKDFQDDLNNGFTAPFVYSGFENVIVPIGKAGISYIRGEITFDELVKAIDDSQTLLKDNSSSVYTTAVEKIPLDNCAKLVGICFAKASGADMALISKNKWYKTAENSTLNTYGVSGCLYPLPITDQEITSILPTGWTRNIQTVTLSGVEVRQLAADGFDLFGDGIRIFPYELVTPEGFTIDDNTIYTVAICGVTDSVAEKGKLTDTGIRGLDAATNYFRQFKTLSNSDIVWR